MTTIWKRKDTWTNNRLKQHPTICIWFPLIWALLLFRNAVPEAAPCTLPGSCYFAVPWQISLELFTARKDWCFLLLSHLALRVWAERKHTFSSGVWGLLSEPNLGKCSMYWQFKCRRAKHPHWTNGNRWTPRPNTVRYVMFMSTAPCCHWIDVG